MTSAIQAERVSKRFTIHGYRPTHIKERVVRRHMRTAESDFWALKDVSFTLEPGTSLGIIGHNGSGKSTALKVLAGIYRPTSGYVSVTGRVSALLELGAGFHPELTGRENIRLNGAILGLSDRQVAQTMDEIIDFAGVEQFIDSPIKVYSSGMVVRLGFAVAARMHPEILIVDEIIAVGDEEFQRKCFEYLFNLRREGATVVLVSHTMSAIENICDRAIWLHHGRLREDGTSSAVVRSYLAHVNAQETRSRKFDSGETPEGVARLGSGEIMVQRLEYLGPNGKPVEAFATGEQATVRIHLVVREDVPRAVVGLGFWHESGVNTAGPNSGADKPWSFTKGRAYVDFTVPSMHLNPGLYEVSAAVTNGTHFFDGLDRAFVMRVRGGGGEYHGLTQMPGAWLLKQETRT